MEPLQWEPKLIEFEHILTKQGYLSRGPLPGYIDAIIFTILNENKKYPDKKSYPNFYHWFIIMKQFSINSLKYWISNKLYNDDHSQKLVKIFKQVMGNTFIRSPSKIKSFESGYALSRQNSIKGSQKKQQKVCFENPQKLLFSFQKQQKKQNYTLKIHLSTIQNLENLSQRLYELKLKIKELRYDRIQKNVFLRFFTDKENCQEIKTKIMQWNEVQKIVCKKLTTKPRTSGESNERSSMTKTTNIRS